MDFRNIKKMIGDSMFAGIAVNGQTPCQKCEQNCECGPGNPLLEGKFWHYGFDNEKIILTCMVDARISHFVATHLFANPDEIKHGNRLSGILETYDLQVLEIESRMGRPGLDAMTGVAGRYYREFGIDEDVQMFRVVYPDWGGKFPPEEGHDAAWFKKQHHSSICKAHVKTETGLS